MSEPSDSDGPFVLARPWGGKTWYAKRREYDRSAFGGGDMVTTDPARARQFRDGAELDAWASRTGRDASGYSRVPVRVCVGPHASAFQGNPRPTFLKLGDRYLGLGAIAEVAFGVGVPGGEPYAVVSTASDNTPLEGDDAAALGVWFARQAGDADSPVTVIDLTLTSEARPRVVVTQRTHDYHACVKDEPGFWDCGRTPIEAIRELLKTHPGRFPGGVKEAVLLIPEGAADPAVPSPSPPPGSKTRATEPNGGLKP